MFDSFFYYSSIYGNILLFVKNLKIVYNIFNKFFFKYNIYPLYLMKNVTTILCCDLILLVGEGYDKINCLHHMTQYAAKLFLKGWHWTYKWVVS